MSIKFFKKTKRSLLARKARKIFLKGRAFLRQSRLNLDAKGAKTNIFGRIFIYGRVVKVFKSAFGFKPRQAFYCFVRISQECSFSDFRGSGVFNDERGYAIIQVPCSVTEL